MEKKENEPASIRMESITVVSLVSYPFLPARTGGERGVAIFNKYFSRHTRLICVTTQKNDPAAASGYEVLNILSNSPLRYINFFYFFTLRRIIRQNGATHLLLEHPYYGWLGVLLKWTCKVKLVVHSHNLEGLRWKSLGKWWWPILSHYERWTHRRADYSFFIQEEDRQYALRRFGIAESACLAITYGIERDRAPGQEDLQACRQRIRKQYSIADQETLLFFNGAFNYGPNREALLAIAEKINPILMLKEGYRYKIMICGKDIPEEISGGAYPNMIFAGFVDDIDLYFKGADVFINPVTEGGGIKTKLVEALGNGLTAVSTRNGAIGISPEWCDGKLLIAEDNDWESFSALIIEAGLVKSAIPPVYFDHFYWGAYIQKAVALISGR